MNTDDAFYLSHAAAAGCQQQLPELAALLPLYLLVAMHTALFNVAQWKVDFLEHIVQTLVLVRLVGMQAGDWWQEEHARCWARFGTASYEYMYPTIGTPVVKRRGFV